MKKKLKVIAIVLIILAVIYLVYIFMLNLMVSPLFSNEHLSKEEIIDVVMQNTELLNEVPNELKSIENTSFYIDAEKKIEIEYLSISGSYPFNKVLVNLNNADLSQKNISKIIKNTHLSKVFEIYGIQTIEKYISKSGRLCILFDCGSSGLQYYYGFYYTEDNQPIGWKGEDVSFKKYEDRWIWKDANDFNRTYITEKIADNWFYFEMVDP